MLKKYYVVAVLLAYSFNAQSQIVKLFLDTSRNITPDSSKARFYAAIKKLDADSAWMGSIFNLRGDILSTGTYRDGKMKIPHGKFTFYGYHLQFNSDSSSFKLYQYICATGYYLEGVKLGMWTDYYNDGYKNNADLFVNGKLNGLHEKFGWRGNVSERGNYIDDKKEGEWDYFTDDSVLESVDQYKNDKLLQHDVKVHYKFSNRVNQQVKQMALVKSVSANPGFNFNAFLIKNISSQIPYGVDGIVVVKFLVNRKGKITKLEMVRSLSETVDKAVFNAMLHCPDWKPATLPNDEAFSQEVFCPIVFVNSRPTSIFIHADEKYDPYF